MTLISFYDKKNIGISDNDLKYSSHIELSEGNYISYPVTTFITKNKDDLTEKDGFSYELDKLMDNLPDKHIDPEINYFAHITLFVLYLREVALKEYTITVHDYDVLKELYLYNTAKIHTPNSLVKILNFKLKLNEKEEKWQIFDVYSLSNIS